MRRTDVADFPVPPGEIGDRLPESRFVIHSHRRKDRIRRAVGHDRKLFLPERFVEFRVFPERTGLEKHAVHIAFVQQPQQCELLLLSPRSRAGQHLITARLRRRDQVKRQHRIRGVAQVADHHPECAAFSGFQGSRHIGGPIVQLFRDREDPVARFGGQLFRPRLMVQHQRDRGNVHVGPTGDIRQCNPVVSSHQSEIPEKAIGQTFELYYTKLEGKSQER